MTDLNGTTFLSGANAEFIAELYTRFLDDPGSVDDGWRRFFDEIGDDAAALYAERSGPAWGRPAPPITGNSAAGAGAPADHAARDHRRSARHLLRLHRCRVHAHPGAGRAAVDPAKVRAPRHPPE